MSCELINPRNLPQVAAEMHRALKSKPCACGKRKDEDGKVSEVECGGCRAMRRYEAITEVAR